MDMDGHSAADAAATEERVNGGNIEDEDDDEDEFFVGYARSCKIVAQIEWQTNGGRRIKRNQIRRGGAENAEERKVFDLPPRLSRSPRLR